jgi:hypothetical protein
MIVHYYVESVQKNPHTVIASEAKQSRIVNYYVESVQKILHIVIASEAKQSRIVHYYVESVQKNPHIVIASEAKQPRIPVRSDIQPLSLYAFLCFIALDCFVPRNDDRVVLSENE